MDVDYLIIGQGISGSFLSFFLLERGASVLVIDEPQSHSPSRVAAGIMNPVTGRRLSTVWRADEILGFVPEAYSAIGARLQGEAYSRKDIVDIFPNPFMRASYEEKLAAADPYVSLGNDAQEWEKWMQLEFGYGEIKPVYTAHLDWLIPAWQNYLQSRQMLRKEFFAIESLRVEADHIVYSDITAQNIIFCDGPAGMENPWFQRLPFSRNKGQALILRIPELPNHRIYKKSMLLVPLPEKEMFWLGASYEWEFEHLQPTCEFREKAESTLKNWLRCGWTIEDQRAGLRPATLERRPFVGLHPLNDSIGIFNGMGTKGCSVAPFFARELTEHLLNGKSTSPEADVQRFRRILSQN